MKQTVGDITAEQLVAEYGMNEAQALKLMQDLPKLCEEMATPQQAQQEQPQGQTPYPYPVIPQDQRMYPYPYPYMQPYPYQIVPQLTPEQINAILLQEQMMANPFPQIDREAMNVFEAMTDEQLKSALSFIDRYLLARDAYPYPSQAGMRPGAMVGYRWPADETARALASLILFGTTGMAKARTQEKKDEAPIEKRNESFWNRVFQTRDAMDKQITTDGSEASILPPPFFYEDEIHVDLDKAGVVIEDGILKAPVSAAAAMVQEAHQKFL